MFFECTKVNELFQQIWKEKGKLVDTARKWFSGNTTTAESITLLEIWWYVYCRNHRQEDIIFCALINHLEKIQECESVITARNGSKNKCEKKWRNIAQIVKLNPR